MEKNILLALVCCVVETCWELPGPLCSALLCCSARQGPVPALAVFWGQWRGFAALLIIKCQEVTQHYCQEHPFLGDNECHKREVLPPSSSSISIQGFGGHRELEPLVLCPCSPCCPQLPGILLPIAPLQLFASVTMSRSSQPVPQFPLQRGDSDTSPCGMGG